MATAPNAASAVLVGEQMVVASNPGVSASATVMKVDAYGPVSAASSSSVGFGPRRNWFGGTHALNVSKRTAANDAASIRVFMSAPVGLRSRGADGRRPHVGGSAPAHRLSAPS